MVEPNMAAAAELMMTMLLLARGGNARQGKASPLSITGGGGGGGGGGALFSFGGSGRGRGAQRGTPQRRRGSRERRLIRGAACLFSH